MRRRLVRFGVVAACAALAWAGACSAGDDPGRPAGEGVASAAPWWNEAVFYEVFVRSFADSDGDGVGDLRGLTARLDYLNDDDPLTDSDLGVSGLWLMPVTQSPSYHGYDTSDYYVVEEDYGTNQDLQDLVAAAHQRGMAVIVDLMLNHTSTEHPWFVQAAADPGSATRDWYLWRTDDTGGQSPWNTPVWHAADGDYYYGLFGPGLPDLNYRSTAVTEQMRQVARFWLEEMGVDGFRLDAVRHLIEDQQALEQGRTSLDTPQTHAWLVGWDDQLDAVDPAALTVGEIWDDTTAAAPYVTGNQVDLTFEFSLADGLLSAAESGDPAALDRALSAVLASYPPGQYAPFLTNHDQERVMTQLGGDVGRAKTAASALLTLPGVPFVYYGEEIGMTGAKPDERIRTPMQWSADPHAGFSPTTPWQPPNDDYREVNVAAQTTDPDSLLSHYRRLIHLRARHPALRTGSIDVLQATCAATYAYLRSSTQDGTDDVIVVINFSDREERGCAFSLTDTRLAVGRHQVTDLLTNQPAADLHVDADRAITPYTPTQTLQPRQTLLLHAGPARPE
jgi:glycosidase